MLGKLPSSTYGLRYISPLLVDKMPRVPELHVVLAALQIIGPTRRLDEGPGLFVHQVIDGIHQLSEAH